MITWNPNNKGNNVTLSNNNLTVCFSTSKNNVCSTEGKSNKGKYYMELTIGQSNNNYFVFGICPMDSFISNDWLESSANSKIILAPQTTEKYLWDREKGKSSTDLTTQFLKGDIASLLIDYSIKSTSKSPNYRNIINI